MHEDKNVGIQFYVLTLFPEIIEGGMSKSIIRRAIDNGIIGLNCVNPRDFSKDKHKRVDDYPYGGGPGMVIAAQPIYDAYMSVVTRCFSDKKVMYEEHNRNNKAEAYKAVYLTPQGAVFNQGLAAALSKEKNIIMLCGHYEGIDERVIEEISPLEISIGDYILSGGELAAMVVIDAVSRLVPGVLGKEESHVGESFANGLLEYPQYTRPPLFLERAVPEVLLSGHHENVDKWRHEQSILRTADKRPDLL